MHTGLHPETIKLKQPDDELLSNYIILVTDEKIKIRAALIEEVFSLKKERAVELLIQRYQSALINLADEMMHAINITKTFQPQLAQESLSINGVYQHILICLEDLLIFIEKHFSRYFNVDERIPESYKLLKQAEFRQQLKVLTKQYKLSGIDESLKELIFQPFHIFIKANNLQKFTYRDLLYLKVLFKELSQAEIPSLKTGGKKALMNLLLYLNFNNYFFINYYINFISKEIGEADSTTQQIEQLAWWLKTISQLQTHALIAYKTKVSSVKEQLTGWLIDEMEFLEKKRQLAITAPLQLNTSPKPHFSLMTSFSVKQVALLIRLLFDTGLIKSENQTEMLTQIAGVLKTERKENISAQNLRAKYYDIDEPTKGILKDCLITMVNQLRKY